MPSVALAPTIRFNGAPLPSQWESALVECKVELPVGAPNRVTLRFVDPGYVLAASGELELGMTIAVSVPPVPGNDSSVELATAELTAVAVDQQEGEQPELALTAMDKSHRLARSANIKTYLQAQYSDVVSQIAATAGLTADVHSTSTVFEYLLQVDTDMSMLNEMAARSGYDWYVLSGTLNFKKPSLDEPVTAKLGGGLRSFSVHSGGHHPGAVEVFGWDRKGQQQFVSTTSNASVRPDSKIADLGKSPNDKFGDAKLATAALAASTQEEADQLSQVLFDMASSVSVRASGLADVDGRLHPGGAITVTDAGPLDGTYPLTRVEHTYRARRGFITRFWSGTRAPGGSDGGTHSRHGLLLGATTHQPGLVVGQVTNLNDPEKSGRVKVRFPGLDQNSESAWARIVTQGGGTSRGSVAIPEVGDEVLVGFEQGDPRQPVVLGGLFGDKGTIPKWTVADGVVSARRTTSRLGHFYEFGDGSEDTEQYFMVQLSGATNTLTIGKKATKLEIASGNPLTIKAGSTQIEFSSSGDITMKAPNITIKADQALKLSGTTVQVSGQSSLQLESNATASLKANASLQMEGSATASLKGGIVQIN